MSEAEMEEKNDINWKKEMKSIKEKEFEEEIAEKSVREILKGKK